MFADLTTGRHDVEHARGNAGLVDETAILNLTREIAHAGARPMAPISAYIWGLAVGAGGDPEMLRRTIEDAITAAPLPQEG